MPEGLEAKVRLTWTGTVYINDGMGTPGELCVEREIITEWSRGPRPDPSWSFVDAAGHFHAADPGKGGYPTLRDESIAMPCDGSCGGVCGGEGYTSIRYSCRICGEEITPGVIEGPYQFTIDGPTSWSVDVEVPSTAIGEKVSVCFENGPDVWFGVAVGRRSKLVGVSELGRQDTS